MKFPLAIASFCLLLGVKAFSSYTINSNDRQENDLMAREALQRLHFYRDGRGMILSPNLVSVYDFFNSPSLRRSLVRRWGVVLNDNNEISGLFKVKDRNLNIGLVGCVVCHSGRAAGQFVVGLGNKNIDVQKLGMDVYRLEKVWKYIGAKKKSDFYREVESSALDFSKYLASQRLGNLTQGLVPVSFIRGWFYKIHGEDIPPIPKGQVKVPALWGYGEKRPVGQFCDGYGNGEKVGWAVAVELAAGQDPQTVKNYYHEVEKAEELLNHLLSPQYPFAIDEVKAFSGQKIFERTCSQCHGVYEKDVNGFPIYRAPKRIPWAVVKTDFDRLAGNTDEFNAQVEKGPLNDIVQIQHKEPGYFAPRLEGIWARYPYLHNGSVPTIWHLLLPVHLRPKYFDLKDAGESYRFDEHKLGLAVDSNNSLKKKLKKGDRDVYDTSRPGHSPEGHEFFVNLSDQEKRDLIEYLKTL